MPFVPKDWRDYPETSTPITAAALEDVETRLSAYTDAQISALISGAPGALDTLNELAAQLTSDESVATALAATVAAKLAKSSNLSDLTDASAARTNLGLGSAATHASSDYDATGTASGLVSTEATTRAAADSALEARSWFLA